MTSAFASQLKAIAATSTHELDLRARHNAHAESLLFERSVAAKQDFDTIYAICVEGFRELYYLDPQFRDFERTLFSSQAKDQDRDQMTKSENQGLDAVIERCLCMLASKLLLKPALKALEWLVRRFRVHVHNVDVLLQTVLPYHEHSLWASVLSIVPNERIIGVWKFIRPYANTVWNVPRHAIAYTMTNNDAFFALTNRYTLQLCRQGFEYASQMRFWGSLVVEAVTNRLAHARSGRKEIYRQQMQDLLLKVIGFLNEAYSIHTSQDLLTICHTIVMLLATKADLSPDLLRSLAKAVADTMSNLDRDNEPALVAISVICASQSIPTVPKSLLDLSTASSSWEQIIRSLSQAHSIQPLLLAYVNTSLSELKSTLDPTLVIFLRKLLREACSTEHVQALSQLLTPLLAASLPLVPTDQVCEESRNALMDLLQQLIDDSRSTDAFVEAAGVLGLEISALEQLLTITLPSSADLASLEDMKVEPLQLEVDVKTTYNDVLQRCANLSIDSPSFLTYPRPHCYADLLKAYSMALQSPEKLNAFMSMSLWLTETTQDSSISLRLATFLLTVACDRHSSVLRRVFALQLLNENSQSMSNHIFEAIFPYKLALLSDPEGSVRKASASLLQALSQLPQDAPAWNLESITASSIYPSFGSSNDLALIARDTFVRFFEQALLPNLDECVLDGTFAEKLLQDLFRGSRVPDLKKSVRSSLLEALCSHALHTETMLYILWIMRVTTGVSKVATNSKNKLLLPVLERWIQTPEEQASNMALEGTMSLAQADSAMFGFLETWDSDTFASLSESLSQPGQQKRKSLVEALHQQLQNTWPNCKYDTQLSLSKLLWVQACGEDDELSAIALATLQDVNLSGPALQEILVDALDSFEKMPSTPSPSKKRKRSSVAHDNPRTSLRHVLSDTVAKLTRALELVQANKFEDKPKLLDSLFHVMSALKRLKQIHHSDLPYLVQSTLSSILVILQHIQAQKIEVDLSVLKTELITDCLRNYDQPQVQAEALLVSTVLANLAPERLIHSIMPVFTFTDQSIFAKDDDHSVNTVNHAIDEIIPAMTKSLRNKKQTHAFLSAMASTISSFVSAVDHIPSHRRVAFYQRLLSRIGTDELGHLLLAMLSLRKQHDPAIATFITDIVSSVDTAAILTIYCHLIDLAGAIMDTSSPVANAVFGFDTKTKIDERYNCLRPVLFSGLAVLKSGNLQAAVPQLRKFDDVTSQNIRKVLDEAFRETIRTVEASKSYSVKTRALATECLEQLLRLPGLSDLLDLVRAVLTGMDDNLKAVTLRVLALQLKQSSDRKPRARHAAVNFLDVLRQEASEHSPSDPLLESILRCMDQILENYGRTDLQMVTSTLNTIIGLDFESRNSAPSVQITVLLTMASGIEVLGENVVPLVPQLLPRVANSFRNIVATPAKLGAAKMNAFFAVFSAVFSHAAYMVSEEQLTDLLALLFNVGKSNTENVSDSVKDVLRIIARKVDLDTLVASITTSSKSLSEADDQSGIATDTLSSAVEAAAKSTVNKCAERVSEAFLRLLQREAEAHHRGGSASQSMPKLEELCIKFIYKLNDTSFRPIFESWIEWGFAPTDDTSADAQRRQTTLLTILTHFFDTLKGLVTSYMTYLLKPISGIITRTTKLLAEKGSKSSKSQVDLSVRDHDLDLAHFRAALTLIRTGLIHDTPSAALTDTSLFATPTHFPLLAEPLVATLSLQTSKSFRNAKILETQILPTITALATATSTTPSTHQTLTHHILSLRRHPSARARLASIQTLQALTGDSDCGDDFIANTIGIGSGEGEGARGSGGGSVFGELMVYVNEMLEDDDENVEIEVRRWVQDVRTQVGEDVFET